MYAVFLEGLEICQIPEREVAEVMATFVSVVDHRSRTLILLR